jgi:SAM-dependent methyltransferase
VKIRDCNTASISAVTGFFKSGTNTHPRRFLANKFTLKKNLPIFHSMKWFPEKKIVPPYSALAPIYDQVMEHVNYKRWAAYVHKILLRFQPASQWVVDISCGTGTFAARLSKYGYRASGLDSSLPMLKEAQRRGRAHHFICADLGLLPLSTKADTMVSLYDSMNYLLEADMWHKAFIDIHRALKKDGLFIFDVSTLMNSKRDFSRYVHGETFMNGGYVRKSSFDRKEGIQKNYFEIKLNDRPGIVFCEHHQQRIRSLKEILTFIEASPFKLMAGYKEFSFEPFDEKCERVHFVLKKETESNVRTA